jgi:hypothetical protein
MRTANFWEFVALHPWFFRYFELRDVYDDVPNEWLGHTLAREIPQQVSWIAIRPFNKGVLRLKQSKRTPDSPSRGDTSRATKTHFIEEKVFISINWSLVRERRPHARTTDPHEDQTVGECIDALRKEHGAELVINAVVRKVHKTTHELEPGSKRRIAKTGEMRETFDIYFVNATQ